MDEHSDEYSDFVRHLQIVMPSIRTLEAEGVSRDYIARLLEHLANWLRERKQDRGSL